MYISKNTKVRTRQSRRKSASSNISKLKESISSTIRQYYLTGKTTVSYANHVKGAKEWLKDAVTAGHVDPSMADAFTILSDRSAEALLLYTAYKCSSEGQNLSYSTAEGIRYACREYWIKKLGHVCNRGDKAWYFDAAANIWVGNPIYETRYSRYCESLKKKSNRTQARKQAEPMSPDDIRGIFAWLDSADGVKEIMETTRLLVKALISTGFILMTRISEVMTLRFDAIHEELDGDVPVFTFDLVFRKTNDDPFRGHAMKVPRGATRPELDCYMHISTWLNHLASLLGRPLRGDDPVFPSLMSSGTVQVGVPMKYSYWTAHVKPIIIASGICKGRYRDFTTHCLRRGAVQWRISRAPVAERWTLEEIKWWGGWASNDRPETVSRYAMNELEAYQTSHGDILLRQIHGRETSDGAYLNSKEQNVLNLLKDKEVQDMLLGPIMRQLELMNNQQAEWMERLLSATSGQTLPFRRGDSAPEEMGGNNIPVMPPLEANERLETSANFHHAPYYAQSLRDLTPNASLNVLGNQDAATTQKLLLGVRSPPCLSLSLKGLKFDDMMALWEKGDPRVGDHVPLRDWIAVRKGSDTTRWTNIRMVHTEFTERHGRNRTSFEEAFGNNTDEDVGGGKPRDGRLPCWTEICSRVHKAQVQRGDKSERSSRRRSKQD